MPVGGDVVGCHKYFPDLFRNLLHIVDAAFFGNPVHQFPAVKPARFGHRLKMGIDFDQFVVVHDVADIAQCKERFDPA